MEPFDLLILLEDTSMDFLSLQEALGVEDARAVRSLLNDLLVNGDVSREYKMDREHYSLTRQGSERLATLMS
jgi:hypothetical protein